MVLALALEIGTLHRAFHSSVSMSVTTAGAVPTAPAVQARVSDAIFFGILKSNSCLLLQ